MLTAQFAIAQPQPNSSSQAVSNSSSQAVPAADSSVVVEQKQRAMAAQMDEVNQRYRQLLEQMDALAEQRRELELMMNQLDDLDAYRAGEDVAGVPVEAGEQQREELEAQQNEIPDLPRISNVVGGVLTPRGHLVIEPSVQYINSGTTRVALEGLGLFNAVLLGDIDVRSIKRETYIGSLTARYGIASRFEAEVKGSWLKRDDATITRPVLDQSAADQAFNADGSGFGDMEFGLRYQFKKRANWPFMVGNLRVKSDTGDDPFEIETKSLREQGAANFAGDLATGSGFWSINPSVTFIYPSDPVAIFGNVGYLWTLEDDKGTFTDPQDPNVQLGFGKVDPGDAIRLNFGMGIGLNDMSSISFSYQLDSFNKTRIRNAQPEKVVGSDVTIGRLVIGYSFKLADDLPFNLAIGIGTTDDAPDTDITFRLPFTLFD